MKLVMVTAAFGLAVGVATDATAAPAEDAPPRSYNGVEATPSTTDVESPSTTPPATSDGADEPVSASNASPTPTPAAAPPAKKKRKNVNPRIPAIKMGKKGVVMQPWVRNTLFTEYYRENYNTNSGDDGFVTLVNRLNVGQDTRLEKVTLGTQVRLDAQKIWFPSGQECPGGNCVPVEDDIRLERVTLRADTRRFGVYAGDYNVNMGRGMGLSVRKIDEIGVDATIKGGRVDFRSKPVRLTAHAGFANRQNSDFATRQLISDPGYPAKSYNFAPDAGDGFCDVDGAIDEEIGNPFWTFCSDFVAGGRAEASLPGKVDVGVNYSHIDFGDEITAGLIDEYLHQVGGDVGRTRIGGIWDTFIGASGVMRNPNLKGTEFESQSYDGYGVYGTNTFYSGTTTFLVEGKHYRDYSMSVTPNSLLQYTENPTLEREDQQVPGNFNATGGRVRADHTWRESGVTLFGNTLEYVYTENLSQSQFKQDEGRFASHNYAGVIYRKPKSDFVLQASGGYRYERWLEEPRPDLGTLRRRFPHAELYLSIPVGRTGDLTHAVSLRGEGRWENFVTTGQQEDFFRGLFVLGYSLSPWFSISYLQGVDTELPTPRGEPTLTTEECAAGAGSTCRPHLWPGVQVKVNFFNSSFIRIFAGRQVGGRVCVNGSCRTVPDFEGIRSEFVLTF